MWGVRRIGNRDDVLLTASYWGLRLMRLTDKSYYETWQEKLIHDL